MMTRYYLPNPTQMRSTVKGDDEIGNLIGLSADGSLGKEIYAPKHRAHSWIMYAQKPKSTPLWRRILRWLRGIAA